MITIEQVKKTFEEVYENYNDVSKDENFIHSHSNFYYSDMLEYHRNIIKELWLSFWLWELFITENESETLVYIRSNNDKTIHVLQEWLPECKTLKWYVTWLNIMEDKANLIYNK